MIGRLAALILLSTIFFIQTAAVCRLGSVCAVDAGEDATLLCSVLEKTESFFYLYKQPLGRTAQIVASGSFNKVKLSEEFPNSRFQIKDADLQYRLTILNVSKVDEATYFCQSGTAYSHNFAKGIYLAVNDCNRQKSIYVKQSPTAEFVQLGDPINLQCSLFSEDEENPVQCPGDHRVHWVRAGSGSNPGIIYIHKNKTGGQKNRTCVYRLSKTTQDSSDSGTYYCAVTTCGRILFGEGTEVEIRLKLDFLIFVLGGLLAGCVTVIAILIAYIIHRRGYEPHKDLRTSVNLGYETSTADQPNVHDGDVNTVNYVALDFSKRQHKRGKKVRDSQQECVYAPVRSARHAPLQAEQDLHQPHIHSEATPTSCV